MNSGQIGDTWLPIKHEAAAAVAPPAAIDDVGGGDNADDGARWAAAGTSQPPPSVPMAPTVAAVHSLRSMQRATTGSLPKPPPRAARFKQWLLRPPELQGDTDAMVLDVGPQVPAPPGSAAAAYEHDYNVTEATQAVIRRHTAQLRRMLELPATL